MRFHRVKNDKVDVRHMMILPAARMLPAVCMLLAVCVLLAGCAGNDGTGSKETAEYTDIAVLSTTDMHGKCWEKDLLTDSDTPANMLRVSSAVRGIRDEYGRENVILIDNGDAFQGTLLSEAQLLDGNSSDDSLPPAMALCYKEAGYDAFVLGNHEFDYDLNAMSRTYKYLEDNGVKVLAGNVVYADKADGHEKGENAFTPYITKTIMVNGHEHKIGILGLENTNVASWEPPVRYQGLQFTHPENKEELISYEAQLYIPEMKKEGCEFIITAYHGGIGNEDDSSNTVNQGQRLLKECGDIDMLILGHDHSAAYTNAFEKDIDGDQVLVVNGGGQQLTQSVFRFTESSSGELQYEIKDSQNLELSEYDPDTELEEKLRPYAENAQKEVDRTIGSASGSWDENSNFFLQQTDTVDFTNAAIMETVSEKIGKAYAKGGDPSAGLPEGLDHTDVDMVMSNVSINNDYVIKAGDLSLKDIYRMYTFQNQAMVFTMTGRQIRAIMEENAENRYSCRVLRGKVQYYTKGEYYTNINFGGLDFTYDMAAPKGKRIKIDGFANGRPFSEDEVYLVATNSYLAGNANCGLRDYPADDALWSQADNEQTGVIQDLMAEYIKKHSAKGDLTPELITWKWDMTYSGDPAKADSGKGKTAAVLADKPEDGEKYLIYYEPERLTFADKMLSNGISSAKVKARGDRLIGDLSDDVLWFTVRKKDNGNLLFEDEKGRFLTCGNGGGLSLADKEDPDAFSEWSLKKVDGGYVLISEGNAVSDGRTIAMQYYKDSFSSYSYYYAVSNFTFNFYAPVKNRK